MNLILTHKRARVKPRCSKVARFVNSLLGLILLFIASSAHAQILVAVDDSFGIPSSVLLGEPFLVEDPGVLKNDTLDLGDGEQTEFGGTAALLTDVANGTLSCPTDVNLQLCTDGSFQYMPGFGFSGSDSFTYRVTFDGIEDIASVTLTACTEESADPLIFSCWKESSYRAKLTELGYRTFEEGFEGSAWDSVRSTVYDPSTAPAITSQGISWTTNHPLTNDITTGSGAARTGSWGGYDSNHGVATGTETECDVDEPPEHCLFHDGLSGFIEPDGDIIYGSLQGAGGYLDSNTGGGNIAIILYGGTHPIDVGTLINVGKLPHAAYNFFGVIDATASGFTGFEFRELDGKIGQARFIFGDDFIIATTSLPGYSCKVNTVSGVTESFVATYEACEILLLGPNFIAADGANLSVNSGREIILLSGFIVEQGATLNANVCGQSLCMTSPSPMPYGCHSCIDQICAIEPLCCELAFDQACLDKVDTSCGLVCE
jgi:hypothetical protein